MDTKEPSFQPLWSAVKEDGGIVNGSGLMPREVSRDEIATFRVFTGRMWHTIHPAADEKLIWARRMQFFAGQTPDCFCYLLGVEKPSGAKTVFQIHENGEVRRDA